MRAVLLAPVAGLPWWVLATATTDDVEFVWLLYAALAFGLTVFRDSIGKSRIRERLTFALALSVVGFFVCFIASSLLNWAWRGNPFALLDRAVSRFAGDVAGVVRVALELWMVGGIAYGVSRIVAKSDRGEA